MIKYRILSLLHLPPPLYGETILNDNIVKEPLGGGFFMDAVSINTSKKLGDIEEFSLNKITAFMRVFTDVFKKLIQNRYHLCYMSLTPCGIGFYKDLFFVVIVKLFRIKLLYHLHGKGVALKKGCLAFLLYRFCFRNTYAVMVSESLYSDIKRYVARKNVYLLPNATENILSDSDFERVMEERLNRDGVPKLLFLSNIVKTKGVFIALEAARILRERGYNFKFFFVGEWFNVKEKEFFARVKDYNLTDFVYYAGFKNGDEKNKIFKESDIFVYPTYNDIFGIVNIEAMQFGMPVVSTYEGAIPEIISDGKTGFLVKRKDAKGLADKLGILLGDKDLRLRMGRAGHEKFLREYTFDRFQERLSRIFKEVISR